MMKRFCAACALLTVLCSCGFAGSRRMTQQELARVYAKETLFEQLPKVEKDSTAYFSQFNGYPWGTPIETILKDGVRSHFVLKGPQKIDAVSRAKNKQTRRLCAHIDWTPLAEEPGYLYTYIGRDVPVINCDYYFCRYPAGSGKYPFVAYAVADGKLIAGMFQQKDLVFADSRWYRHAQTIAAYMVQNISRKSKIIIGDPRKKAHWGWVSAHDAAGAGYVYYGGAWGNGYNFILHVYSPEWIRRIEEETPLREQVIFKDWQPPQIPPPRL